MHSPSGALGINGEWGGRTGLAGGEGEAGEGKQGWGEVCQHSRRDKGFMNERGQVGRICGLMGNGEAESDWLQGNGEASEGKRRWEEVCQHSRRDKGFMNERGVYFFLNKWGMGR